MDTLTLAASTWTYLQECDLSAAIRRLQSIGFARFDVLMIPPDLWPYDCNEAHHQFLRTIEVGFESPSLPSTDQSLCSATVQKRQYAVTQLDDVIDLCEIFDVPTVFLMPGRRANSCGRPWTCSYPNGALRIYGLIGDPVSQVSVPHF